MNSQRWQQIKRVFAATLERPAGERIEYLRSACGTDDELLAEVCSLLEAEIGSGGAERPILENAALTGACVEWKGRRLGSYRIVSEVGRGGMSHVYKAVRDDDQYHKQVAIKLLRPGLHTQSLLQRFRAERQMLAELSHPNIAQLLDGGVTDTQAPYLVMEYIEGRPIDAYCDERSLDIRRRLELMRTLCGAVHYVHQHLVVHGDLKGNNILVTNNGIVKLLDFGIAKLLTANQSLDNAVGTMLTWIALTPEYASPEQVRGDPITTASDVYSLGVLLYRLVAGALPFETSRDSFITDIVDEHTLREPPLPSAKAAQGNAFYRAAVREVRGDLDAIVMKALRPEPHDRYSSAEHLAEELTRYLRGVPVHAQPATSTYRLRKFVQRHKAASISTSLLAVAMLAGVIATGWQTHIAREERARAERHYNEVRELTNTYLRDVYDAAANLPGATAVRKLLVENSLKHISALESEAQDSIEFQRDLAWAYQKFGDVQGDYLGANLGDTQGAVESYRHALRLRESIAARSQHSEDQAQLLRSHVALSELLAAQSQVTESVEHAQAAVRVGERLAPMHHATDADRRLLAVAYTTLGTALRAVDTRRALLALESGRALFERLAIENRQDASARRDLALISSRIGQVHLDEMRQPRAALPYYMRASDLAESLLRDNPLSADIQRASSFVLVALAEAYNQLHEPDAALPYARTALQRLEALRQADPANGQAPLAVAYVLNRLGESHLLKSELDEALQELQRADELIAQAPPAKPTDIAEVRLLPGTTALRLGKTHALLAVRTRQSSQARQHRQASEKLLARSVANLRALQDDPVLGRQARAQLEEARQVMNSSS
jgi:eukaryotic-like serine/threonine-protein kinase